MENAKSLWHVGGVLLNIVFPNLTLVALNTSGDGTYTSSLDNMFQCLLYSSVLLPCNVSYIFTFLRKILLVWKIQLSGFYILQGAE